MRGRLWILYCRLREERQEEGSRKVNDNYRCGIYPNPTQSPLSLVNINYHCDNNDKMTTMYLMTI
jgi:hypothetical protein